jgi:hypothetical protein
MIAPAGPKWLGVGPLPGTAAKLLRRPAVHRTNFLVHNQVSRSRQHLLVLTGVKRLTLESWVRTNCHAVLSAALVEIPAAIRVFGLLIPSFISQVH